MSTGVVTAKATDTVRSVAGKMLGRHCGAILVVDDEGKLLGLVAVRDVMIPLYPNYGITFTTMFIVETSKKWKRAIRMS